LLDITRLISRSGRVLTGVDRVELAYLRYFLTAPVPLFGLARTTLGYVLVDQVGLEALYDRITGKEPWGPMDALSLTARKKGRSIRQAESDLRRFAQARCLPSRLGRMLVRHVPENTVYFNVGHSNLTARVLWAVRHNLNARVAVFIHDTIPLDYPEFQRPGTPERFRAMLKRVRDAADILIFNSLYTRERAAHHMSDWGPLPKGVVAPLGVDLPTPDASMLPADLDPKTPYFVTVGTIEPRKNHALLLDVWDDMIADRSIADVPPLYICGSRGWNNEEVFQRLDALPTDSPVRELQGLSDAAIAAMVQNATALLFPSEVEGFGLPVVEAAALQTPVICKNLSVYREVLGDIPVYLNETDRYLLRNLIESLLQGHGAEQTIDPEYRFQPPTWKDHFELVLAHL
jgi:glycosyltransferase involved in cell wall biosynthesis